MNEERIIKELYGEEMWDMCNRLFSEILERPGLLSKILEITFYPSRFLYKDIVEQQLENGFREYIYNCFKGLNNNEK